MRNKRRPPAIDPRGFLAACLAAALAFAAIAGWVSSARAAFQAGFPLNIPAIFAHA
jgi:hypothetical protein